MCDLGIYDYLSTLKNADARICSNRGAGETVEIDIGALRKVIIDLQDQLAAATEALVAIAKIAEPK